MVLKQLSAIVLASVMTVGCISNTWAEDKATPEGPSGGAIAAAVVSDLIYIPGKVGTCVLSAGLWTVAMSLTAGVIYKQAGEFVHGCCGGKWVITGEDIADN